MPLINPHINFNGNAEEAFNLSLPEIGCLQNNQKWISNNNVGLCHLSPCY